MKYYKIVEDRIVSLGTVEGSGDGNITEQEYNSILALLTVCPENKVLIEDGSEYSYADAPTTEEIEDSEALAIILGERGD